jgi:hypothetical protein
LLPNTHFATKHSRFIYSFSFTSPAWFELEARFDKQAWGGARHPGVVAFPATLFRMRRNDDGSVGGASALVMFIRLLFCVAR